MADNILGTKITDLEEAQAAGLTDDALLIVEPETPPTKRSKLSTFFTWMKGKLAAWILSSYDEVMAATETGYLVDALAVKNGFTQLNTKFIFELKTFSGLSWNSGIQGQTIGTTVKNGYTAVALIPTGLQRASTTLFSFQISSNGAIYMTTNSTYSESNASETIGILWMKN